MVSPGRAPASATLSCAAVDTLMVRPPPGLDGDGLGDGDFDGLGDGDGDFDGLGEVDGDLLGDGDGTTPVHGAPLTRQLAGRPSPTRIRSNVVEKPGLTVWFLCLLAKL